MSRVHSKSLSVVCSVGVAGRTEGWEIRFLLSRHFRGKDDTGKTLQEPYSGYALNINPMGICVKGSFTNMVVKLGIDNYSLLDIMIREERTKNVGRKNQNHPH